MLAKPINLLLVYVIVICNMVLLCSPVIATIALFTGIANGAFLGYKSLIYLKVTICWFAFLASFMMLLYFFFDLILGFSTRASLKNCTRYERIKKYDFLSEVFEQVKNKFDQPNVKLYVKDSKEINAYAISSFGVKAMVLTSGLIEHYLRLSADSKKFLYSLRSIMGHEMSHLVNKDFLPTFIIIANQKATNILSKLVSRFISLLIFPLRIFSLFGLSVFGFTIADLAASLYNFSMRLLTFFNRFIVYNIYEFLRRCVSRSVEYRCDKQSAQAFGGQNMALSLSYLGNDGYFTLFSTHPGTKPRIARVQAIKSKDGIITPSIIDALSNYLAIFSIIVACFFFAKQAAIDVILYNYIRSHDAIYQKLSLLYNLIRGIL